MKEIIGAISVLLLASAVFLLGPDSVRRAPCICSEPVRRQVRLEITCLNKHNAPCRTSYKVPLLQSCLPQQRVEGLIIEPKPDRCLTDGWQNRWAVYEAREIPARQEFKIVQRATITNCAAAFALKACPETAPEETVYAPDIKASAQEEQELRPLAESLVQTAWPPLFKAAAVYDYLRRNFSFEITPGARSFTQMLREKRLQCADAALLNSKLLQLCGLKARTASGFIIYNEKNGSAAHSWSELYLPDCGFVPADPTQGRYPYTRQLFFGKYAPEIIFWYRGEDGGCQINEYDFPDVPSAAPVLKMAAASPVHQSCAADPASAGRFSVPAPVLTGLPAPSSPFSCSLDKLSAFSSSQALRFVRDYPCLTAAAEPLARLSWTQANLQSLSGLRTPLADLVKAWIAIYGQSWAEAEKHLSAHSQDMNYKEAELTEAALTFQYEKAARILGDLSGSPLSPLAAESCLQLWQDLRLWPEQLVWADYFCRIYPGDPSFILKAYSAAYKSGDAAAQKKYMQLWRSAFPRDGYIYLQAGQLCLEKDDYSQSLEMFRKALTLELAPEEKEFCLNLIASLEKAAPSHK